MNPNAINTTPRVNRFQRGWELTKSSWSVLKLDKELVTLPMLGIICSVLAIILLIAGFFAVLLAIHGGHNFSSNGALPIAIVGICLYAALALIGNFFSGAVIYGATQRFRGGNPTVRSSIAGAGRKFGPLASFSLMVATVGLALQLLGERLPLVGKFVVNLLGAAWSVANVFAVPVIVLSEENVKPLQATKESVNIIRRIWGESVVVDLGVSLIGGLSVLGYVGFWILVGIGSTHLGNVGSKALDVIIPVAVLGLVALMITVSTLTSIAKAALYHYATTGEAPELFNQQLLQASMTQKKARRIFA